MYNVKGSTCQTGRHHSAVCCAQLIREAVPPVARWVSAHRTFMSLANNSSLIVIVWIQLCSAHDKSVPLKPR